ncbi:hypothetical protein HYU50_04040 [Candidatus Woesearchaeota archaeon]|nr:hypothetical protein [Candidatus Woesearchaeota archaeon]
MALSKEEAGKLKHESHRIEHKKEPSIETKAKKKKIIYLSVSSIIVVLIISAVVFSFANSKKPGALDDFAKCLTEKGAVMYGASFCKYTSAQKGMLGNSMKYINYMDFTEDPNIKVTPTWLINGKYYENAQSLDRLSQITGCAIGQYSKGNK